LATGYRDRVGKPYTLIALLALGALAAPPASAEHRAGHRHCESAGAGERTSHGRVYNTLETRNISCRKGERLMKAFARRYGWPPPRDAFTSRIKGFRCRARFESHDAVVEGGPGRVVNGAVACRKGSRRVHWFGAGPGEPRSIGAPD
jgi:hypothetical protein